MLLLTWHGTILRVEQSQKRLIHAPLVPVRPLAQDLSYTDTLPGGMRLHAGPHPGAAHISRDGKTLRVAAASPYPTFDATPATPDACVLPLTEHEAAALRALLATSHRQLETGDEIPPATLEPGFILTAGSTIRLNLAEARPSQTADSIVLPSGAGTLAALPPPPATPELPLHPTSPPPLAADANAFAAATAAALSIQGATEYFFLPLTESFATRDWFYTQAAAPPLTGAHSFSNILRRAQNIFLLSLSGHRTIFTRDGVLNAPPPPAHPPPYPAGLAREADIFFVAESTLAEAPILQGPHALLPNVTDHTLLETILPLMLLAPHLPPNTTLLLANALPDSLLARFGLAGFRTAAIPTPLCAIETLFWPDPCARFSADIVRAARRRAETPVTERRRVFVQAGVANAGRLADIAAGLGYEILAAMPDDPAALFAAAQSIIAAHAPALENALFCAPGTQILELARNTAWRPVYAHLSDQLGLVHAVLPCAGVAGALLPEPAAFRRLLRILQARPTTSP